MIIIEGKKEDVSKRLKQKFEYDGPFIDRLLNTDPTGYKYVDYISRKLEKIIPELSGPKGGLNINQAQVLQDLFSIIIPWFHNNVNRITEDDIWKAESNFRDQYGVVPNIEGIVKSPKDIIQYENPQFIKSLMNIVDNRKTDRDIAREAKSQSDRIYEDDDVLVIRPKSHAASCYYGANTKWCTTTKGHTGYFDKYFREGNLYYFLNKKTGLKLALFKNKETREIEVFDAQDRRATIDLLRTEFPQQSELIDELTGTGEFIKGLREFSRGKIDSEELEKLDESILDVKVKDPLGQSIVIIDFKNDENLFNILDLNEDDKWFLPMVTSHYSNYEFMDSYQIEDDFKEGYSIYAELNDSNVELLKKISELILPQKKFDLNNDEFRQELSKTLLSVFERETDSILSDYHSEKEHEMSKTARETIEKDFNEFFESIGFKLYRDYDELSTTVANLLMWSAKLNLHKIDAISLFRQIVDYNGTGRVGGWAENSYEFQDSDNFDSKSFNNYTEKKLEEILEKIEESEELGGEAIKNFLDFRNRILNKFDLEKWYKLPKDEKINFRIEGFNREEMKVIVRIDEPKRGYRNIKLSEDNFYNLLYQPELFEFGEL